MIIPLRAYLIEGTLWCKIGTGIGMGFNLNSVNLLETNRALCCLVRLKLSLNSKLRIFQFV